MPDYPYCETIIRQHSSTFHKAFSHLEEQDRHAVYAIYAYCRITDDAIDAHRDLDRLMAIRSQLEEVVQGGQPDDPVFSSLADTWTKYHFDPTPFFELITGMEDDYYERPIKSDQDLTDYCYKVAGTVGLMLNPVLASKNMDTHASILRDAAIHLGYGMQITNILRDVGEDFRAGRVYLPKEELDARGIKLAEIMEQGPTKAYIELMEHYIRKAKQAYRFFYRHVSLYNNDAVLPTYLAGRFYEGILDEIRRANYDNLTRRNYVSKARKKRIALMGRMRLWWKGLLPWH
jgi:phytoene/squalene synthetase